MDNILLIITCILAGYLLKKTPFFNKDSSTVLNKLIIYFFIPLIAIYQVPKIVFEPSLIWLTLCPFIIYIVNFIFFQIIGPVLKMERDTKASLILTAGIGSTSFVGFPIFELLYGEIGLAYGILMSLGGTILVFNTLGISTLLYYSEDRINLLEVLKKILRFIPFIAFILGVLLNIADFIYPPIIDKLLSKLTSPFSIIALISIGMQVEFNIPKKMIKHLLLGQFCKLILAPLIIYFLLWQYFDVRGILGKICILGAAIGSMNAMSILTAEKKINPDLSILMPAIGIPVSVPILFIIDQLLK